jgi:uncharacterized protein (DUF58 family)
MPISSYRFIEPHVLAAISDLALLAKTVVDGFMLGRHQSPKLGAGLEFNQYRSYQAGDDLRRVDWKMYARSDRYFVRESDVDTSINVRFLLDASASMAHEEGGVRKFDYARFLAAALAYLAHTQGDAIGLDLLSSTGLAHVAPKRERQHLHHLLHELEAAQPAGRWPPRADLEKVFSTVQKRELIVVISDVHEQAGEIFATLSQLQACKNEVLLFQIMARRELEFAYQGFLTFEDLETGGLVQVNVEQARAACAEAMQQRQEFVRQQLHERKITGEMFVIDQPLDFALRNYLLQRAKTP